MTKQSHYVNLFRKPRLQKVDTPDLGENAGKDVILLEQKPSLVLEDYTAAATREKSGKTKTLRLKGCSKLHTQLSSEPFFLALHKPPIQHVLN